MIYNDTQHTTKMIRMFWKNHNVTRYQDVLEKSRCHDVLEKSRCHDVLEKSRCHNVTMSQDNLITMIQDDHDVLEKWDAKEWKIYRRPSRIVRHMEDLSVRSYPVLVDNILIRSLIFLILLQRQM